MSCVNIKAEVHEWYGARFKSKHFGQSLWIEALPVIYDKTLEELMQQIGRTETDKILTRIASRIMRLDPVLLGEQLLNMMADGTVTKLLLRGYSTVVIDNVYRWLERQSVFSRAVLDIHYINKKGRK